MGQRAEYVVGEEKQSYVEQAWQHDAFRSLYDELRMADGRVRPGRHVVQEISDDESERTMHAVHLTGMDDGDYMANVTAVLEDGDLKMATASVNYWQGETMVAGHNLDYAAGEIEELVYATHQDDLLELDDELEEQLAFIAKHQVYDSDGNPAGLAVDAIEESMNAFDDACETVADALPYEDHEDTMRAIAELAHHYQIATEHRQK